MIELSQALLLTLIGMGMTFAAIGLLVVGMIVMTALIKDRSQDDEELPDVTPGAPSEPPIQEGQPRHIAAAAAVSVALAEPSPRYAAAAAAVAVVLATQATPPVIISASAPNAWNAYVRGQQLSRRRAYDLKRR